MTNISNISHQFNLYKINNEEDRRRREGMPKKTYECAMRYLGLTTSLNWRELESYTYEKVKHMNFDEFVNYIKKIDKENDLLTTMDRSWKISEDRMLYLKGKICVRYYLDYSFDCRYLVKRRTEEPCRYCMFNSQRMNTPYQFTQYRSRIKK